jgi:uncharacterized repeat protein (TIGR01451 family)
MTSLIIFSLSISFFVFTQPVTGNKVSVSIKNESNLTYPRLFVTKTIDEHEAILDKTIVVTITIKNIGNQTAYNVTFIDQLNHPWIFEVSGLTHLSYNQIGDNETRQFSYLITPKSLGTFSLYSAKVEYYHSEVSSIKYTAFSNDFEISVIEPPEDFSLANFNSSMTLLIILVFFNLLLLFRLIAPKLTLSRV